MLEAPFLRRASLDATKIDLDAFPFGTVAYLTADFEIAFDSAVTIFVGENGSGKSTLIEAIAQAAGFSAQGGSQDHQTGLAETGNALTRALRLSWEVALSPQRQLAFLRILRQWQLSGQVQAIMAHRF